MERNSIHELIRFVNGQAAVIQDYEKWVTTNCPLARFTHEKKSDKRPSLGIKIESPASYYYCHSCGYRGTLSGLLKELYEYTGEDRFKDYFSEVEEEEIIGAELPDWSKARNKIIEEDPVPIDPSIIELFDPASGHSYLRKRGIKDKCADSMGMLFDPDQDRILFPLYDLKNNLYGFTGRSVDENEKLRVKDYFGLPKSHFLLGAEHIQKDDEFVIVVEGLFDYARLFCFDLPVCAVMKSTLSKYQAEVLLQLGKPVILMFDNDAAGRKGKKSVLQYLYKHLPVSGVSYPEGVKDPAVLSRKEVQYMLTKKYLIE